MMRTAIILIWTPVVCLVVLGIVLYFNTGGEIMFNLKLDGFESSNIAEFGYSSHYNVLRAKFKNNTTYDYFAVPLKVFEELQAAESKGKAFNLLVKKGGYEYKKVERG